MSVFKPTEWNVRPEEAARMGGKVVVSRNVTETEREGVKVYVGESAVMTELQFAAYVGAKEVAAKREQEIVDETILNLIEEGSL